MGFSDPGYKASAGKHIFCRLDQQGCFVTEVQRSTRGQNTAAGSIRVLCFHKRKDARDQARSSWLQERAKRYVELPEIDGRLLSYILWRDVTPKNPKKYFRETQFVDGSWLDFKAVEAFDFGSLEDARAFLRDDKTDITKDAGELSVVVGNPDTIF